MIAYALIILQVLWVILAAIHRLREGDEKCLVFDAGRGMQALILTTLRPLIFALRGFEREPSNHAAEFVILPADGPAKEKSTAFLDDLVVWARDIWGAPFTLFPLIFMLLTVGLMPVVLMVLASYGLYIGDITAKPDVLAAMGAYVVASICCWSGRSHTKSPLVYAFLHPLAIVYLAFALALALLPSGRQNAKADAGHSP